MEIETKTDKEEFSYTDRVGTSQVLVECDIDMESRGGIEKVLSVTGNVIPDKVEAYVGEAKVYGKVLFKVLYLSSDKKLSSIEYCSDFVESMGSADIDTTSVLSAKTCLVDIDNMVRAGGMRLQAVVDVALYILRHNTLDVVKHVDGAIQRHKDIETSVHICHINELCDITDSYDTGTNVDKILSFDTSVCVTGVRCAEDIMTVTGEANASILYMSEGKLATKNLTIPYSEELKAFGATKSSSAIVDAHVRDSRIVLGGDEDANTMDITMTICIVGDVYEYGTTDIVDDVYSACHSLAVTRCETQYDKCMEYKSVNERVSGETSIEQNIAKVVGAFAMPSTKTNVRVADSEIEVETLLATDIVYMDENGEYERVQLELPLSVKVPSDIVKAGDRVDVDIVTEGVMAKCKRDHDIEVSVDIAMECTIYRCIVVDAIESIEVTGDIMSPHKVMSVYFVKAGDDIWDVMKGVGASREDIMRANKDIDVDHLVGGERIIVYRGIN